MFSYNKKKKNAITNKMLFFVFESAFLNTGSKNETIFAMFKLGPFWV